MTRKTLLLAALLTLPLAGCTGVKRPYSARLDPYPPSQVQVADKRLEGKLVYGEPNVSRDAAGLLYVAVPIRPATSRSQIVNYRFTFLDDTGRELPGGAWQAKKLQSNITDQIQGNSTTPRAADFRVDLRTAE